MDYTVIARLITIIIEKFHDIDLETLAERPRSQRTTEYANQIMESAESPEYETIPADHIYVALDSNDRRIVAVFPQGLKNVYGPEGGEKAANIIKENIARYIELKGPSQPRNNSRYTAATQWMRDHPLCGTFHWGLWEEQAHPKDGPKPSKDLTTGLPARIVPMLHLLHQSLRNITRAVDVLFGATDNDTRNAYQESFRQIPPSHRTRLDVGQDGHDQLFTLRVLLIDLWTQPHRDAKDWHQGWAWIAVFGEFTGGDFGITELKRRIPFPHGAVLGLRGGALEHWTTKWDGQCRYSLVHTFHEYVKSFDPHKYPGL